MSEELHTICPFCGIHHELVTAARADVDFPHDDMTMS
jgi:hypothetical protein